MIQNTLFVTQNTLFVNQMIKTLYFTAFMATVEKLMTSCMREPVIYVLAEFVR